MIYQSEAARVAGRSWERIDFDNCGDDPRNWGPCASLRGHTAGRENSLHSVTTPVLEIGATPNPFNPDGDGRDDETHIRFSIPSPQSRITVSIFNQRGNQVRQLVSNHPAGQSSPDLIWNGRDDQGRHLPTGRYIILLEAIDSLNGEKYLARCTVVLARQLH